MGVALSWGSRVRRRRRSRAPLSSFQSAIRVPLRDLLAAIGALLLFYVAMSIVATHENDPVLGFANAVGPLVLVGLTLITVFRTARRDPLLVFTPYLFFLAGIAIYFGLGPLVFPFSGDATQAELRRGAFAIHDEMTLLRTNLLSLLGIWMALLSIAWVGRVRVSSAAVGVFLQPRNFAKISVGSLAAAFLITGAILRFGVFLPYLFMQSSFTPPGILTNLWHLTDFGFLLAAYLAFQKRGIWWYVLVIFLPIHVFSVALEFSKNTLVLSLILPALGAYLAHRRLTGLLFSALGVLLVFMLAQPLVDFARHHIALESGEIRQASLSERRDLFLAYAGGERLERMVGDAKPDRAWMRLAYGGVQGYIMHQREAGIVFESLDNIWLYFVPRLIWPEKPVGFAPGAAFYEQVTGRRGSLVGGTIYADAYWNFGWFGVIGIGLLFGVLLGVVSRLSVFWLRSGQMLFLPLIFMGLNFGVKGSLGWIANSVVAFVVMFAFFLVVAYALLFVLGRARVGGAKGVSRNRLEGGGGL